MDRPSIASGLGVVVVGRLLNGRVEGIHLETPEGAQACITRATDVGRYVEVLMGPVAQRVKVEKGEHGMSSHRSMLVIVLHYRDRRPDCHAIFDTPSPAWTAAGKLAAAHPDDRVTVLMDGIEMEVGQ